MTTDRDTPVGGQLGKELQDATYPAADTSAFLRARDEHGAASPEARGHLATELRRAQSLMPTEPDEAQALIDGVVAALEDRR